MTDERVQQLSDRFPKDVSEHYQQMIPAYQKGYADYVFQTDQEATQNRRIKQLAKTFRAYATKPYHYLQPLSPEDAMQVATDWQLPLEQQGYLRKPNPAHTQLQVIKNGLFFGYCWFEQRDDALHLAFAMAPRFRGLGHGRAFYQAIEDYLRTDVSARQLILTLSQESAVALAFAETIGFHHSEIKDGYIIMTKSLIKE